LRSLINQYDTCPQLTAEILKLLYQ
jgi:hypothetical protein